MERQDLICNKQINDDLLRPILHSTWRFYVAVFFFASVLLAAGLAFAYQVREGIGVAGITRPVMIPRAEYLF